MLLWYRFSTSLSSHALTLLVSLFGNSLSLAKHHSKTFSFFLLFPTTSTSLGIRNVLLFLLQKTNLHISFFPNGRFNRLPATSTHPLKPLQSWIYHDLPRRQSPDKNNNNPPRKAYHSKAKKVSPAEQLWSIQLFLELWCKIAEAASLKRARPLVWPKETQPGYWGVLDLVWSMFET